MQGLCGKECIWQVFVLQLELQREHMQELPTKSSSPRPLEFFPAQHETHALPANS
jgi:hypothetical protein